MTTKNSSIQSRSSDTQSGPFSIITALENLEEVKGDFIYAILFLPVALTFQKLAEGLIEPDTTSLSSMALLLYQIIVLAFFLIVWIVELFFISMVLFNLRGKILKQLLAGGIVFILFMLPITVMGFVVNFRFLFEAAFIMSMITSFGTLYLLNWDEQIDESQHVLFFTGFLAVIPPVFVPFIMSLMQKLGVFEYVLHI